MSKRKVPKFKNDKRYGVNTWGLSKSPVNKGKTKVMMIRSGYAKQMKNAKTFCNFYCNYKISQCAKVFKSAYSSANSEKAVIEHFESSFDTLVFRSGMAATMSQARQFINHKHFSINAKPCNIKSIKLNVKDVITVNDDSSVKAIIAQNLNKYNRNSKVIAVDKKKLMFVVQRLPQNIAEVEHPFETNLALAFNYFKT